MNAYERRVLMHVLRLRQDDQHAFHAAVKTAMHDERKASLEAKRYVPRLMVIPLLTFMESEDRFNAAILNLIDQGLLLRKLESLDSILARQASRAVHAPGARGRTAYILMPRAFEVLDARPTKQMEGTA